MIDSQEIPEDILKEAERVLAGFKVTVSGEPQVTVFDYPQWRLLIAFSLLRERRRHETQTPPPATHVEWGDWTVADTDTAREILNYLGYGSDASREPGADRRRDKIAAIIRARIDAATAPAPEKHVTPDAAARLERILRLGRSMKWTPHGAPALDDEDTAVALGELFQIFFQDAVDRALATTEGSTDG